jgi:hypothetical protein
MSAPVDVLAVIDGLIAAAQATPQPGSYYPTPWAKLWDHELEKPARKGSYTVLLRNEHGGSGEFGPMSRKQAEAKAAELNGFTEARAAVAELIEAARAHGELIHSWRETGVPPSLRELAHADDRLATALARVQP